MPNKDDAEVGVVCGNCKRYREISERQGQCFANPPLVMAQDGALLSARPIVNIDEPACMLFLRRLNS